MSESFFTFIEAPIYQGQNHFGVALGPGFIRQCLLDQDYNFQTLSVISRQSKQFTEFRAYEELSYLVEREVRRNKMVFTAGGDHSLSIGSIQGLLRVYPELKVIWVDAHGDINTRSSSLTGALHGMPLGFLTGEEKFKNEDWFTEYLKPENLIYFGVRDLDYAEKVFLDKKNICYYTTADIQKKGLANILSEINKEVAGSKLHLSVDSDAFDPSLAPSTGLCVAQGLTAGNVEALLNSLFPICNIISYEYVELNPQIFCNTQDVFKTAQIGINLFNQILSHKKSINNHQHKESHHGIYDRQRHSNGSNLLYPSF